MDILVLFFFFFFFFSALLFTLSPYPLLRSFFSPTSFSILKNRVDRTPRISTLCNKSDIEDEYHLVLVCPIYGNLRQKYIRPCYYNRPSVYTFTLLMQTEQQGVLQKLGKYVYESFRLRSTLITS